MIGLVVSDLDSMYEIRSSNLITIDVPKIKNKKQTPMEWKWYGDEIIPHPLSKQTPSKI